jgi:hypothetical protein
MRGFTNEGVDMAANSQRTWEPSEEDALNVSALRLYALKIESLSLLIYRSDPVRERPRFAGLQSILSGSIEALGNYAASGPQLQSVQCGDNDALGTDGLCHPPGESSS